MGTEKYGFGARVLNISVPIFLSFVFSVIRMVRLCMQISNDSFLTPEFLPIGR